MTLFDEICTMKNDKWDYYGEMGQQNQEILNDFTSEKANRFINQYFKNGKKSKVFDVSFLESYILNGKHQHTVSLYLLGCYLNEILDSKLQKQIKNYIREPKWYNYKYTWFLTCLYHDTASVIEKEEYVRGCKTNLDFYLGKYNIKYNVFNHNWINPTMNPFTYSENLVKNYFQYRIEECDSIDHGIIAGYLLYDKLVKNYNENWDNCNSSCHNHSYDKFTHYNLNWRFEHLSHFAYIANAIIAHNIWYSNNTESSKSMYRSYGLDTLIYDTKNRISIKNDPLVFFLGLLDTLEPIKFFYSENVKEILKNIKIKKLDESNIEIIIINSLKYSTNWFDKIEGMKDWLNVNIERSSNNKIKITIL